MKASDRVLAAISVLVLGGALCCAPSIEQASNSRGRQSEIATRAGDFAADDEDEPDLHAIDALVAQEPWSTETADECMRMTRARSGRVRSRAVWALGHVANGRIDVMRQVSDLVGDPAPEVASQAAATVGRMAKGVAHRDTDQPTLDYVSRRLVAACGHANGAVRRAAIEALLVVQPAPDIIAPIIAEAFRTADSASIMSVLGTLADMGEAAVPLLQKALEDPAAAYWAGVIVADIGPAAAATIPALRTIAGDDSADPAVRLQAIFAIAAIGSPAGSAASPELVRCLAAKEDALRMAAAFALGSLQATTGDPSLRIAANDNSPAVASMAAWAIARMHPDDPSAVADAVYRLKSRLLDGDPTTRVVMLSALAKIAGSVANDDRSALAESVVVFLADADPEVRSAAANSLQQLGSASADVLAAAIREPSSRQSALAAIPHLQGRNATVVDALVPLLSSGHADDIIGACLALVATGGVNDNVVAQLKRILTDPTNSSDVHRFAAHALGKFGAAADSAVVELRAARESADPLLRVVASWAVANIRPGDRDTVSDCLARLKESLSSDDENIRMAASLAIGELGTNGRDALGSLVRVARDDPTLAVREVARDAIERIQKATSP